MLYIISQQTANITNILKNPLKVESEDQKPNRKKWRKDMYILSTKMI